MQKMLVSDYDDTFFTSNLSIHFNKKAIEKFRKRGNTFVLSTGRNFISIFDEIKKHNIKYDYLSCLNGRVIFDKNNKIVKSNYIKEDTVKQLLYFFNRERVFDKPLLMNERDVTSSHKDVVDIKVILRNIANRKKYIEAVKHIYPEIEIDKFLNILYIRNKSNKADAIKDIQKITSIIDENIYTIGNAKNDLQMLQEYNSSAMLFTSLPNIIAAADETSTSVSQYIKKIERRK